MGVITTIANIAVYTSIASLKNYERGYGLFVLMQYSLSGIGLYYLILYADFLGAQGLYLFLASLNFIALLMIRSFPDLKPEPSPNRDSISELKLLFTGVAFLAVVGFGIHEMSGVAQFTYIERIGANISILPPITSSDCTSGRNTSSEMEMPTSMISQQTKFAHIAVR